MIALTTFLPRISSIGALAAFSTSQRQLRLKWQRAAAQRQEIARITLELADCTDRQLADLGISRSEIPSVANGTYRRG